MEDAHVMQRLLVYGPRVGFVVLLALLGAFAMLFVREAHDARAAIEAQRVAREAKLTEQVQQALSCSLDVGEALMTRAIALVKHATLASWKIRT